MIKSSSWNLVPAVERGWAGSGGCSGCAVGAYGYPCVLWNSNKSEIFACFDQGPNFFPPKENHGREFVGFGRLGGSPFLISSLLSSLFKGLLPPSINNRSVCSRSSKTGVFLSPSEGKTIPSQHILCNFGRGGGWFANSIFSSLDSLINIPKDSKEETIPVLLGFFSCSCLGLALSSWE